MEKYSQRVVAVALLLCGIPTSQVHAHPKPLASGVGFVLSPKGEKRDASVQKNVAMPNPSAYPKGEGPKEKGVPSDLAPRNEHFPLWLELSGASLGLASVIAGGILRIASVPPPLPLPKDSGKTLKLPFNGEVQGLAMMLAGAQLAVVSLVFLAIDRWPRRSYTAPRLGSRLHIRGAQIKF